MNLMRRTLPLLVLLALVAGCRKNSTTTSTTAPSTDLIFQDEFSGSAGSSPSASRWRPEAGTDWGNQQLEYDTGRPTNVSHDGAGHLVITARAENYLGSNYTSARINTKGLFAATNGRFEARMKLPIGQGIWPAFWMLGANIDQVGWPTCGEIDIMEMRGQAPATIWGSLHGPGYSGGGALTSPFTLTGSTFNDAFHVFAVEWSSARIIWQVDGVTYKTVTPSNLPANAAWVFNHPFSILLNLAVGGNFVGAPNASTVFPQSLIVDYVRVYRINP